MYNWNSSYNFYGKTNNKFSNGMTKSNLNVMQPQNGNSIQNSNIKQHFSDNSENSNDIRSMKIKHPKDFSKNNSTLSIDNERILFEIFGIKIYFDDVLILCILLFLYQENIHDEYLFIALILLLLS